MCENGQVQDQNFGLLYSKFYIKIILFCWFKILTKTNKDWQINSPILISMLLIKPPKWTENPTQTKQNPEDNLLSTIILVDELLRLPLWTYIYSFHHSEQILQWIIIHPEARLQVQTISFSQKPEPKFKQFHSSRTKKETNFHQSTLKPSPL